MRKLAKGILAATFLTFLAGCLLVRGGPRNDRSATGRERGAGDKATPTYEVTEKSIPELADAMASGTVTSRALVEQSLARIRAYDQRGPSLNAMPTPPPASYATTSP